MRNERERDSSGSVSRHLKIDGTAYQPERMGFDEKASPDQLGSFKGSPLRGIVDPRIRINLGLSPIF